MATIIQSNKPNNYFYWFLLAVCLAVIFIMCSCDCNYHLKQAKKKCGISLLSDTIHVRDTIFIKESRTDTIFKRSTDTVRINNDRLHIKYFYNNHDSTVYIAGKCDSLIVYRDKAVIVNNTNLHPDPFDKYKWWIAIGLLVLVLIAILRK